MVARIMIMAGGTGGHVFPGLAVAQELRARGVEIVWMGTRKGLEAEVVPKAGIDIAWVTISGLRGKGIISWLSAPIKLARAVIQAMRIVHRYKPAAILGMGGFVAGPGGIAAWLLRRPLIIHEQNAVAGMTNRMLAPLAAKVLEAFPNTFPVKLKAEFTGNPVRSDIAALAPPEQRLQGRAGALRLLVIGGSLGAQVLNEAVPAAIAQLSLDQRPEVWHQTGKRNVDSAKSNYLNAKVEAKVEPFITDMAAAYAWADLVLCRAGALTIAELAAAGLPSILVPYTYAVDDHQTHNAAYLTNAHAAALIPQQQLTAAKLAQALQDFCLSAAQCDRSRLLSMATTARHLAKPDATRKVADCCMEVAHA